MKVFTNYLTGLVALIISLSGMAQSTTAVTESDKIQPSTQQKDPVPATNQWWQLFQDPLLDSLIQVGIANNLEIKSVMNRLEESRTRIKLAESYRVPSVRFDPYASTQNLAPNRPLALQVQDQQVKRFIMNTFQLPIDVSYEVDIWQRYRKQIQVNQILSQATEAERQAVQLTVTTEIARSYLLLQTTDTEKRVLEQGLRLRDSTLQVVKARYKAGLTTEMDVQRAQTEVATIQIQLQSIQRTRSELELSLAVLTGAEPTQLNVPEKTLAETLPVVPAASASELPLHRPDLIQSAYMTTIAEEQVRINKAALRPRLNLIGSAGLTSRKVDMLLSSNSATYMVGGSIVIPIYEGNRNRNNVVLAQQQVQTATSTYQQRVLTAKKEVETALVNLQILTQQNVSQQQALESALKTRSYSRELYVKGLTTFLDVVDSERTALDLQRQAVNLHGQQALYTVALIKALGGSW
ncbi:efflux transporter outer membrane subunit [Xanthocytophaga agilis]|uniref:Efflux transporter outer membrane subunit n=1 Tax=Xanthocytophaga agilis TaxID=3048010 RepID=A0AAE3UJB3_9BACT|nr:efflux transporter outer membrane subunit [Xanthocytophaga agilis]MDJ1504903.1 efflux transporter outer membrane subunit [Xanthocytophaga agilis]